MALEAVRSDADDLIRRHLTLVRVAVARVASRVPPHVDRDDLVAAGHLGLVQAARAFDPSRGVPFDRYAQLRITGAIQDELRSLDSATRRGRAAMRRLDQATEILSMQFGRLPSTSEVARWLGEDTGGVNRARTESAHIAALRRPRPIDDSDVGMPPSSETDPEGNVLDAELRQDLADAIKALPPRLALVVVAHVLDGREVKSIAADFGVTPSRVSQLCGEALLLLRSALDDTDDARDACGARDGRPASKQTTSHLRRATYLERGTGIAARAPAGAPADDDPRSGLVAATPKLRRCRVVSASIRRRRAGGGCARRPAARRRSSACRCGTGTGRRPRDRPASQPTGADRARRGLPPSRPVPSAATTPVSSARPDHA